MNVPSPARRALAATAALALGTGLAAALPAAATAAPGDARGITSDTIDYYDDVYPSLRAGSVFETLTYERFEYLLGSEGTFAVLIGGPADPSTQAAVAHIDAVAQEEGIETIYNFDPRLDGVEVDVRTSDIPVVADLWTNLVDNYLSKDTESSFADADDAPYLLVYDKDRTDGEAEDRIVAALTGTVDAADLATEEGATAYRAEVAGVLGGLEESTIDLFDFYRTQYNTRHASAYRGDPKFGGDILGPEDADFRIQQLTYPELVNILDSEGEYVLFFGGTWCHNTRAVVKEINAQAAAQDVEVVYNFDLRLDGLSGNALHIRDSNSPLAHLYGELVDTYLPNLVTQFQLDSPNPNHQVAYHPGGDAGAPLQHAKKLQVPFLLQYDKDNLEAGAPAPVTRGWIGQNAEGGPREYMTEWWFVNELPGYTTDPEQLATQYAFAAEAIAQVETFFTADATAPTAPAAPVATVSGSDVTVTWTAPADNGAPITGYTVSLTGGSSVEVGADVSSHTFAGLAPGNYSATVVAHNEIGASPASAPSAAVSVVPAGSGEGEEETSQETTEEEEEETTGAGETPGGSGTGTDGSGDGAGAGAGDVGPEALARTGLDSFQLIGLLALTGLAVLGGGALLVVRHRRAAGL